jgi:hypothetical protein
MQKSAARMARNLETQIKDPELRKKLQTNDPSGCKRPLMLDSYYPALAAPNVTLLTDPVVGLSETGILSQNIESGGLEEKEVGILIWGTGTEIYLIWFPLWEVPKIPGYKLEEYGAVFPMYGRGGKPLAEQYGQEACSLYGWFLHSLQARMLLPLDVKALLSTSFRIS